IFKTDPYRPDRFNCANCGILFVPNVKSHSWVTVIMREKAWHIVRPTTIR
uniref:Uncharacterized protein n=1 Tax=Gallus gallus TaxID=9031 RepID=A0A8V0YKP7_CHICK